MDPISGNFILEQLLSWRAEIVEQDLPVKPQLVGRLPEGLKIKNLQVTPSSVKALPADAAKNKKTVLTTTPIYLESISDSAQLFCKIVAPPSVQPVEKRWPDVEVVIWKAEAPRALVLVISFATGLAVGALLAWQRSGKGRDLQSEGR